MATIRVEKTKNYTVMSNCHLRDRRLSLKARGMMSIMLSLPDDWDYTVQGLQTITGEGRDSVKKILNELKAAGYLVITQTRENGTFGKNEYIIYESPVTENPLTVNASTDEPSAEEALTENLQQLNTDIQITKKQNTEIRNIESINQSPDNDGSDEIDAYISMIKKNVGYDEAQESLSNSDLEIYNELVDTIMDVVCVGRKSIMVNGEPYPYQLAKSKFLKLKYEHLEYVSESLKKTTSKIKNVRSYMITALYNAPSTMNTYYQQEVNHDFYGGESR